MGDALRGSRPINRAPPPTRHGDEEAQGEEKSEEARLPQIQGAQDARPGSRARHLSEERPLNQNILVAPSAPRTADWAARISNPHGIYGRLVIDVTAIAATPSVVFTIRAVDPVSGKKADLLASAAIVGVGTTTMKVGPNLAAVANVSANDIMPRHIEIDANHADADSITYSLSLDLIG